jgi:hypothetical protein
MSINSVNNYLSENTPYTNESLPVSWQERDRRVQVIIDESFRIRVQPLHKGMFEGRYMNYICVGAEDYTFNDLKYSPYAKPVEIT